VLVLFRKRVASSISAKEEEEEEEDADEDEEDSWRDGTRE
jgi:hypothetical protein